MIVRGKYQIVISPDQVIDLADISEQEFNQFKKLAQQIMANKETDTVIMAYLAAFTVYVMDLQILAEEFDPDKHLMN